MNGRAARASRYPAFVAVSGYSPADAITEARRLADGAEAVVWVHESMHAEWGLPDQPGGHAELFGADVEARDSGWLTVGPRPLVHVSFPAYSGDFAGYPTADALLAGVAAWRDALGFDFLYSGASTLHAIVKSLGRVREPAEPEPELPAWRPSSWSVPASSAGVKPDTFAWLAGRRWVRCFDRNGSYLAAWSGLRCGFGEWTHSGAGVLADQPETWRPAGYWLVERDELPDVDGMFDPFRRMGDHAGAVVLTTPLVQLAGELRGEPLPFIESWTQDDGRRPLDAAAKRVGEARRQLAGPARDALKVGYAAATAWFEFGPKSGPMARPLWRRSIIDRHVANTYRALSRCATPALAVSDVDAAVFVVDAPDALPDGLRVGDGLGMWKPKGEALAGPVAAELYERAGVRAVVGAAEVLTHG